MTQTQNEKTEQQLEGAFNAFTQVSEQLVLAYSVLENQVTKLNSELNAARSERLVHLAEKERIACRLESLLTALPGGVVVIDGEGRVAECNPAATAMLGEPLLGELWNSVAKRAFDCDTVTDIEVLLRSGRRINITSSHLDSEPGKILLLQDITEQRALQQSLEHHRRLSSMGEMVASLAHQVRTPLSSALLYCTNLKRDDLDPASQKKFAEKSIARLHQLNHMVSDMLGFAKGGNTQLEQVNLGQLISDLKTSVAPLLAEREAQLTIKGHVPEINFTGNHQALMNAFQNLVINASQSRLVDEANVHITLETKVAEQQVIFKITDDGPGISSAHIDRIFEPFYTTRNTGTGLGLAVVRAVILSHNGTIKIESAKGKGATFILGIPLNMKADVLPSGSYFTAPQKTPKVEVA
ncbi:Flagellar sensor histidine kinase FleS [hydrothermal vent metagenome]|uniref:histidine kinase n=1 Tax=hydrothermal vent metagenome TaxID=652676 RepID=A0A3B0YTZ5_9ZZZZ